MYNQYFDIYVSSFLLAALLLKLFDYSAFCAWVDYRFRVGIARWIVFIEFLLGIFIFSVSGTAIGFFISLSSFLAFLLFGFVLMIKRTGCRCFGVFSKYRSIIIVCFSLVGLIIISLWSSDRPASADERWIVLAVSFFCVSLALGGLYYVAVNYFEGVSYSIGSILRGFLDVNSIDCEGKMVIILIASKGCGACVSAVKFVQACLSFFSRPVQVIIIVDSPGFEFSIRQEEHFIFIETGSVANCIGVDVKSFPSLILLGGGGSRARIVKGLSAIKVAILSGDII